MKPALEWINAVGEAAMMAAFAGGQPPGTEVEAIVKAIQDDAIASRQWREIATAPKDGTQILVSFVDASDTRVCCCVRWKDDGWRAGTTTTGERVSLNQYPPSHWQPLPSAP